MCFHCNSRFFFFFKQAIYTCPSPLYLFGLWMKQPFVSLGRGYSRSSAPLCFSDSSVFLDRQLSSSDWPPPRRADSGSQTPLTSGRVGGPVRDAIWPVFGKSGAERGLSAAGAPRKRALRLRPLGGGAPSSSQPTALTTGLHWGTLPESQRTPHPG